MQIRLYGDSLSLPRVNKVEYNQRFISLFLNFLKRTTKEILFIDRARANYTITDLYRWYLEDKKYFGNFSDIIIIQAGVVDCAPRPVPNRIRKLISFLPEKIKVCIIRFLHNNRSKLQKLGFKYFRTNIKKFKEVYSLFINDALKHCNNLYIINIAPTNDEIEHHSPGFKDSIYRYNTALYEIIKNTKSDKLKLVDVYKTLNNQEIKVDKYIFKEDGHHITIEGNKLYAEFLISLKKNSI